MYMKSKRPIIRVRYLISFLLILSLIGSFNLTFNARPAQALGRGIHEVMAEYGLDLWWDMGGGPWWKDEMMAYLGDIKNGASNEDETDHVWDYYGTDGECITITHFWDPDLG